MSLKNCTWVTRFSPVPRLNKKVFPGLVLLLLMGLMPATLWAPPWTWSGNGTWSPPSANLLGIPTDEVPMDAKVYESPARIDLRFFKAGTYKLYRKNPATTAWGAEIATVTVTAVPTTWSDTNVVEGEVYEYGIGATTRMVNGVPVPETKPNYFGNVLAGIKVDRTLSKGRIALVVAEDIPTQLPEEYAQYKADLAADGWVVHEISTPRANDYTSNGTGPLEGAGVPTAPFPAEHINIRNQLITLYNSYPTELKNVVLLGKVAVARSGVGSIGPDGHGNRASVGADAYYADMDGIWTDTGTNFNNFYGTRAFGFINNADGSVMPPSGYVIDATFLRNLRASYPTGGGGGYALTPDGKYIVYAANGSVQSLAKTISGVVNNADGSVTLPSTYIVINQDALKNARLAGSGFFLDGQYVFTVSGGNITGLAYFVSPGGVTVAQGTLNVPGDNKFDPTYFYEVTNPNSRLELGYGRIDFSNNIPSEYESMRMYFNKLHRYKTASADFQPGRRVCNRMNAPPTGDTVQTAMLRSMPGLVGMENIELITNTEASSSAPHVYSPEEDRDSAYTRIGGPFLFYFKGSGPPAWGLNGRAVFWTGLQSHWGYWFESGNNTMLRRLAEDNFALSYAWSIWGVDLLYHRMGMGFDVGDMMRLSLNDRTWSVNNYPVTSSPTGLFINHLGCPSLRLFMFPPPTALSVVKSGGNPSLSWTAAVAPPVGEPQVLGYHVYRASGIDEPFTRLTSTPVTGTTFVDTSVNSGGWVYQVKAVRLETTGGGTYYNTSLGTEQSIDLDNAPTALTVVTASLPEANWNTPYQGTLTASGGVPVYEWSVVSGSLPPGLTLSPSGAITGLATAGGTYAFTMQATDRIGQTAQKALLLTVQSDNSTTFYAEANSYCGSFNTTKWGFGEPSLLMSGPVYLYQPFIRFDLSGFDANNSLTRAKLILTLDERSQANSYAVVKAALTQDAGDAWTESGITWASRPLDEPNVPQVRSSSFPVAYGTIELDVTDMVRKTLNEDAGKKLGLRLYTNLANGFGSEVRIVTRYAPGNARPRLVIETTDGPAIALTSPTVNPASIHVGSSLVLNATVTPIPAHAGALSVQWSKLSGPGTVTFSSANTAASTATFSTAGDYVLRLSAYDGVLTNTKDLTVRVLAVPPGTAAAFGAQDASLILRLPFDEGTGTAVADFSGVSPANNGTLATIGATGLPTRVTGKAGGALNFDGTGQRVEIPDPSSFPVDGIEKMTLSLWVKLNAADANSHALVSKRTSTSSSTTAFMFQITNAEKLSATISNRTAVTGDSVLNVGQWYHAAMVFDGSQSTGNLVLYLDGSTEKVGTVTGLIPPNLIPRRAGTPLRIGDYTNALLSATSLGFNGQIDEVRIYNRALSITEIQELALAGPSHMGPKIVLNQTAVSGTAGQPVEVGAVVTDDGLPGALTLQWQKASGPGSVVFSDPVSGTTDATPSTAGSYGLRLLASDGSITTFADVAATFEPSAGGTGIANWRQLHFGTTENTGDAADDANPMGDGLRNLLKYALGLNPNVDYRGSGLMPKGQLEEVGGQEYLTYTFTRNTAVSDVTLSVEVVNDLTSVTWGQIDPLISLNQVEVLENTPSAGIQTITVKDTQPVGSSTKRFMRLKVTRP
jgi:hypothetical protein